MSRVAAEMGMLQLGVLVVAAATWSTQVWAAAVGDFPEHASLVSVHGDCEGPPLIVLRVDDVPDHVSFDLDSPVFFPGDFDERGTNLLNLVFQSGDLQNAVELLFSDIDFPTFAKVWGPRRLLVANNTQGLGAVPWGEADGCLDLNAAKGIWSAIENATDSSGCAAWPDLSAGASAVRCFGDAPREGRLGAALESLGDAASELKEFRLGWPMDGEVVPRSLFELPNLERLDLRDAGLSGALPSDPALGKLKIAWLGGNSWSNPECVPDAFAPLLPPDPVETPLARFATTARMSYECIVGQKPKSSSDSFNCWRVQIGASPRGSFAEDGLDISAPYVRLTNCLTDAGPSTLEGSVAFVASMGDCAGVETMARYAQNQGAVAVVFAKAIPISSFAPAQNKSQLALQRDIVIPVLRQAEENDLFLDVSGLDLGGGATIKGRLTRNLWESSSSLAQRQQRVIGNDRLGNMAFCGDNARLQGFFGYCAARQETLGFRIGLLWCMTIAGLLVNVLVFAGARRIPHGVRRMLKATLVATQLCSFVLAVGSGDYVAPSPSVEMFVAAPVQALGLVPMALSKTMFCAGSNISPVWLQLLLFALWLVLAPLAATLLGRVRWPDLEGSKRKKKRANRESSALPMRCAGINSLTFRVTVAWWALPFAVMLVVVMIVGKTDLERYAAEPKVWLGAIEKSRLASLIMFTICTVVVTALIVPDRAQSRNALREGTEHTPTLRTLLPLELRLSGPLALATLSFVVAIVPTVAAGFDTSGFGSKAIKENTTVLPIQCFVIICAIFGTIVVALRMGLSRLGSAAMAVLFFLPVVAIAVLEFSAEEGLASASTAACIAVFVTIPFGALFAVLFRNQDHGLDAQAAERYRLRALAAAGDPEVAAGLPAIFRMQATRDTLEAYHNALLGALGGVTRTKSSRRRQGIACVVPCCGVLGYSCAAILPGLTAVYIGFGAATVCVALISLAVLRISREDPFEQSRGQSATPIRLVRIATFRAAVQDFVKTHGRVPRLDELKLQTETTNFGEFVFVSHKWFDLDSADSPEGALTRALYLITGRTSVKASWGELGERPGKTDSGLVRALMDAHVEADTEYMWVDTFCVDQTSAETITADIRAIPDILLQARESVLMAFEPDVYCASFWCCVEAAFLSFRNTPLIDLTLLNQGASAEVKHDARVAVSLIDQSMLRFESYRDETEIQTLLRSLVRPLLQPGALTDTQWIKLASLYNALAQRANMASSNSSDQRLPTFVRDGQVLLGQQDSVDIFVPSCCAKRDPGFLAQSTADLDGSGVNMNKRFVVRAAAQPATGVGAVGAQAQPRLVQPQPQQPLQPLQPGQQVMLLTPAQVQALQAQGIKVRPQM